MPNIQGVIGGMPVEVLSEPGRARAVGLDIPPDVMLNQHDAVIQALVREVLVLRARLDQLMPPGIEIIT